MDIVEAKDDGNHPQIIINESNNYNIHGDVDQIGSFGGARGSITLFNPNENIHVKVQNKKYQTYIFIEKSKKKSIKVLSILHIIFGFLAI